MKAKIIYEKHPVTAERKAHLRSHGYKIRDARFAPEGYQYPKEMAEPSKAGGKGAGTTKAGGKGAGKSEQPPNPGAGGSQGGEGQE